MNPVNITDIFFDLDHTLWDFEKNSAVAFETIFAKHKITLEMSAFLGTYIPINNNYWTQYQRDEISKEELRTNRLRDSFRALGYSATQQLIDRLADDYIEHLPNSNHLFPGVLESLDYLHKKYRLHIITNGFREVQQQKMSVAKIDHYFKTVTTSEDAGVKKPNPKIFAHALEKASCGMGNSLMIGDNLEADIQGALDFGMQTIHFSNERVHPGLVIQSHEHLFDIL